MRLTIAWDFMYRSRFSRSAWGGVTRLGIRIARGGWEGGWLEGDVGLRGWEGLRRRKEGDVGGGG
jgi:hypothetical protein